MPVRKLLFVLVFLLGAAASSCVQPDSADTSSYALAGSSSDDGEGDDNGAHCDRAADRARESKPHKISICHIPPGNPGNAHTINISKKAVEAHLAHGDVLGGCGCSGDDDGDTPGHGGNPNGGGGDDDDDGSTPSTNNTPDPDPTPTTDTPGDDGGNGDNPPSTDVCDTDQTTCETDADCGDLQACDYGCCVDVIL